MRKVRPFRGETSQLAAPLRDAFRRRPILDRAAERELIDRLPCPQARAELIEANLRLAAKVAARHRGLGVEFEDLVSEAFEGLCTAADRFDARRTVRFGTYATWWIRKSVLAALQSSTPMRIPRWAYWLTCRDQLGPEYAGVAEFVELAKKARRMERLRLEHDLPGPGGADDDAIDAEEALRLLRGLSEREQSILARRFGIGCEKETLDQIGRDLGLTRERIRQIEFKALAKLREKFAA